MLLQVYVKFRTALICKKGQSLMEYALLAALIAIALIATLYGFRKTLIAKFNDIKKQLSAAH
jgi:Flp pilus assembly pilin Flp